MGGVEAVQENAGIGTYALAGWLFLRVLGFVYLAAFISLGLQIRGLLGQEGILPATELLAGRRHWGATRFWRCPTLFWFNSSDRALVGVTRMGAVFAVLLILGIAPLPVLALLWISYLSLFTVGRLFLCYQWDILLLEAGFLALLLAPLELTPHWLPQKAPSQGAILLFWWLLFRLMFWSGMVKLRSGDHSWRKLVALQYHYESQPLPTRLAWYAHQLPPSFHKVSVAVVLGIELLAPLMIFVSAPLTYVAAGAFIFLMVCIELMGNYAFFNLLGAGLSLLVLDDRALRPFFSMLIHNRPGHIVPAGSGATLITVVVGLLVVVLSLETLPPLLRRKIKWPPGLARFYDLLEPFHLVNSYGLFAVMTTWRPEIILEGSYDGHTWEPYEFKWKPDDVNRPPRFVAPHQPRLDWQMWFLAIGGQSSSWFERLRERLVQGSPAVINLFRSNPFPDGSPRYVRGVYYDYRLTKWSERKATGAWWRRERRGVVEG